MPNCRVYLLSEHQLLMNGIESLIETENRMVVVGRGISLFGELSEIQDIRPDVIFVDQPSLCGKSAAEVSQITGARIVEVDLRENRVTIHDRSSNRIASSEELISALLPPQTGDGGSGGYS